MRSMKFRHTTTEPTEEYDIPFVEVEKTEEEPVQVVEVVDHGDRQIVTSILLEILYGVLLYFKAREALVPYLYALIPLILITALLGTWLYNRDGDMKLFGAITKLSASGIALQLLVDELYTPVSSFSLIKYGIGFGAAFVFILFYSIFRKLLRKPFTVYLMIAVSIAVYIVLLGWGYDPNGYGTTAWVKIGSYTVQLTDASKVAAVLFYSALFSAEKERSEDEILILSTLFFGINLIGAVLVHELGSFFILLALHLSILFIFMESGTKKKIYLLAIAIGCFSVVAFSFGVYKLLLNDANAGTLNRLEQILWPIVKKVYTRFSVTANINSDPYGAGYQLLQGKKAMWFAGLLGNTINFTAIPVPESDMAFIAFINSFGWILGFYVVYLFLRILLSGLKLSRSLLKPDIQDSVTTYGITMLVVMQAAIVILGSCNVIPFAGLPIPFLSRGGTYQTIVFCFTGLLLYLTVHDGQAYERKEAADETSLYKTADPDD